MSDGFLHGFPPADRGGKENPSIVLLAHGSASTTAMLFFPRLSSAGNSPNKRSSWESIPKDALENRKKANKKALEEASFLFLVTGKDSGIPGTSAHELEKTALEDAVELGVPCGVIAVSGAGLFKDISESARMNIRVVVGADDPGRDALYSFFPSRIRIIFTNNILVDVDRIVTVIKESMSRPPRNLRGTQVGGWSNPKMAD
jgi:hypothetical protein